MKNAGIWYHKIYLDYLFSKGDEIKDDELLSHWSRYLCVLVSGWLETSVHRIYSEYIRNRSSKEVRRFASNRLGIRSAKMNNIIALTSQFSVEWAKALENVTDGPIKDAVDNIVENRHHVAHGETSDISFLRLKTYYANAIKAVELLEKQCAK